MRRRGLRRDLLRNQEGAALIEATMILPILLVLVFGLTELSLFLSQRHLAEKAVQLGLRRAVTSDTVAAGPGLSHDTSGGYWNGLPPGARCGLDASNPCPILAVMCDVASGCTCRTARCGFTFSRAGLAPILAAMNAVLPELRPENLQVGYETNGLGYVARPGPVSVDVTIRLVGVTYRPIFLDLLFRAPIPLRVSGTLPSEDLVSD